VSVVLRLLPEIEVALTKLAPGVIIELPLPSLNDSRHAQAEKRPRRDLDP